MPLKGYLDFYDRIRYLYDLNFIFIRLFFYFSSPPNTNIVVDNPLSCQLHNFGSLKMPLYTPATVFNFSKLTIATIRRDF